MRLSPLVFRQEVDSEALGTRSSRRRPRGRGPRRLRGRGRAGSSCHGHPTTSDGDSKTQLDTQPPNIHRYASSARADKDPAGRPAANGTTGTYLHQHAGSPANDHTDASAAAYRHARRSV